MRFSVKASHLPQRIAAGAFILNSGLGKWSADDEAAAQLHGFAVGTYPFLAKLKPRDFVRLLSASEIALGAALLLPVVPSALAGAGLAAFSGGVVDTPAASAHGTQHMRLTQFLRDQIAPHKIPVFWSFVDGLPMTPTGKTQKFVLRQQVTDGTLTFDEIRPSKSASQL